MEKAFQTEGARYREISVLSKTEGYDIEHFKTSQCALENMITILFSSILKEPLIHSFTKHLLTA